MEKRLVILSILWTVCIGAFAQKKHVVQKGEKIEDIAKKYGVRVDELEAANPIAIKYCYVTTQLVIPEHVPNEEEIRAMEEEKARLIALREQEEAERAKHKEDCNDFFADLFGAVVKGFVVTTLQSALTPTNVTTSQSAQMYNTNVTSTSSRSVSTSSSSASETESHSSTERLQRRCSCKAGNYYCACERTPTFGNEVYHTCPNCGASHRMGVHSCKCKKCGGTGSY